MSGVADRIAGASSWNLMGWSTLAPSTTRHLPPIPNPHQMLHDLLQGAPSAKSGRWSSSTRAGVVRCIFLTFLQNPEYLPFFELDGDNGGNGPPLQWTLGDWVTLKDTGDENFSLAEAQKRARRARADGSSSAGKGKEKERPKPRRRGKLCGKTLHRYDRTYTCRTCAVDASCVLCVECFQASNHEGHDVSFSQSYTFSSACDCGDRSAWKDNGSLGCSHHPPALDPSEEWDDSQLTDNPDIPEGLIAALQQTIQIVLDYALHMLMYSSINPSDHGQLPANQEEMLKRVDPYTGAVQIAALGEAVWSVVAFSDDRHVMREVVRQIKDATGATHEQAEKMAKELDHVGRKIIATSVQPAVNFHVASMLQQIEVAVCIRRSNDSFREELVGLILSWISDMCHVTIGGDAELFRRLLFQALVEKRQRPGAVLNMQFPRPYPPLPSQSGTRIQALLQLDIKMWKKARWEMRQMYANLYALGKGARRELAFHFAADYLKLFEDFAFIEREADSNLMYCIAYMVIMNEDACHWALERNSLISRIILIAIAWYTDQVKANHLTMPPLPIVRPAPLKEAVPDKPDEVRVRVRHIEDTTAFRQKKGITLWSHLRAILRHDAGKRRVGDDPELFAQYVHLLNLFVGMQPQKRELEQHIEFEVEWTKSFSHLGELVRNARDLGGSLAHVADPSTMFRNIATVIRHIFHDVTGQTDILMFRGWMPLDLHHIERDVLAVGSTVRVVRFSTLKITHFSFHEYLHLVLAEAIKVFRAYDRSDGRRPSLTRLFEDEILGRLSHKTDPHSYKIAIFEAPIRKLAVLSHIKADLWRRNGVGMRGQLHHYREVSIRDLTVDQEFWLIQFALCVTDNMTIFTTLIDRFALTEFFRGNVIRPEIWDDTYVDTKQNVTLLEEFLLLVLHLATDTWTAMGATQDEITRDYLIHQLALNNWTYTELVRRLPESSEKTQFTHILREIADFKEPTETVGGSYILKPELLDTVDPFWHHYSRNDIRTATEKVTARMKKLDPSVEEPVILPKPLRLPEPSSMFSSLGDWLRNPEILPNIIHYAFAHSIQMSEPQTWPGQAYIRNAEHMPQFDLVLDVALQLAMVALQVNAKGFCERSIAHIEPSGSMSIFQDLWFMQEHEAFKPFKHKIDHVLSEIVRNLPADFTQDYRRAQQQRAADAQQEAAANAKVKPAPKRDGKAMQAALLARFQKQQAAFTQALGDETSELQALMEQDGGLGDGDDDDADDAEVVEYGACIVCQEPVTNKETGGLLALLQPSRIVREVVPDRDWFEESLSTPSDLDRAVRYQRYGQETSGEPAQTDGYPSTHNRFGVHMSACSHVMHEACMTTHFEATRLRHAVQIQRHHPENAVRLEYLCPLCKSLSNGLIPLDPTQSKLRPHQPRLNATGRMPTLSERIRQVSSEGLIKIRDSAKIWDHHVETGELSAWFSDTIFAASTLDPSFRKLNRSTCKMVERYRSLLRPLSEQSQRIRNKKTHMYMPDDMVNYTISAYEIAQRGLPTPGETVAEQVPEISMRLVQKLINLLQLELDMFFGLQTDRTALRVGIFARFLPDWYRASSLPSPVLLRQSLVLVIEAAAIAPDLVQPVIVLGYYLELTRVMLGLVSWAKRCLASRQPRHTRPTPPEDKSLPDALSLFEGFRPIMAQLLRNNAGPYGDVDGLLWHISEEKLYKLLYSFTLPYLRRAAILYYAVAGGYPVTDPEAMTMDGDRCEYRRLLARLGIPPPVESLTKPNSTEGPIVARWLNQWAVQGRQPPLLEFPGTYELYRLSNRYEDVMLWYADRKCDNCKTKPSYPAVCLFCGAFVCMSGDCCAVGEQGELNIHVRSCGAVTGLFVDLKRWLLVYIYVGSGSFGTMPYLDVHGELDPSMRRGTRQYMHLGRMEEVRKATWLNHTIPHLVARRLEMSSDHSGWGTL